MQAGSFEHLGPPHLCLLISPVHFHCDHTYQFPLKSILEWCVILDRYNNRKLRIIFDLEISNQSHQRGRESLTSPFGQAVESGED